MSFPTRATSNRVATIWPFLSEDEYGQTVYGTPYTVRCTFERGSTRQYNDALGTKYIPKSIYWYEFTGVFPELNDLIALGNHVATANPVDVQGAELIKNRTLEDNSLLSDIDDVMVLT